MEWGYNHDEERNDIKEYVLQNGDETALPFFGRKSTKSDKSDKSDLARFRTSHDNFSEEQEEDADIQEYNEEIINSHCMGFSKGVYERLPDIFTKLISYSMSERVKPANLLSMFTVLSAAMPNVKVLVREKWYSTHIYTAIIGPAGCGKGAAIKFVDLLSQINERYDEEYRNKLLEYKYQQSRWRREEAKAIKEGREPDYSLEPLEKPQRFSFLGSANTSRSQLVVDLQNAPHGVMIATSELGSLTTSLKADYGNAEADLRSAAMNEVVDSNFKHDDALTRAVEAKLALLVTGTFDQYPPFMNRVGGGLPSRVLTYLMGDDDEFIPWADYDEDMSIALSMMDVLVRHACIATTMLLDQKRTYKKMDYVFAHSDIYSKLPEQFTITELADLCRQYNGPERSGMFNMINRWEKKNLIKTVKRGFYQKIEQVDLNQ